MNLSFTVYGTPQQRGSKTPRVVYRKGAVVTKNGRPVIATMDSNKKSGPWMAAVSEAAAQAYNGPLLQGPVELSVVFYFPRPKSHYRTGRSAGIVKDYAPLLHSQTPDLGKLVRSIEDACTGIVYGDDRQIARYGNTEKRWTEFQARAEITIESLAEV